MKDVQRFFALALLSLIICSVAVSAPRKVLAEMFTSTTCPPCYAADLYYFHTWLPNYGGADQIVTVAYHVWWPPPGNDPMYLANPTPVQTRNSYYGNNEAPNMRIDGFTNGGSNYSTWPGAIEPRFLDASPITITLSGTRTGNTLDLRASIFAEAVVNSTNWRVHWVVVEDSINEPQNTGSGYVPFIHNWAHRGMYPDANGSAITISQGQTVNIDRAITLSSNWVANNCKVIVFVQNNGDKKVQNAEVKQVSTLLGVTDQNKLPRTFSLSQNYPNPFNPTTTLTYLLSSRVPVSLKIYNLLGEEVRELVSGIQDAGTYPVEWDGTAIDGRVLPSGVYTYQLVAGSYRETRKMLLLK